MNLQGKKMIILGERDGIQSPAIAECLKNSGGEIVHLITECFVWTAAGSLSQETQQTIKNLADQYGAKNLAVMLGGIDLELIDIMAETLVAGDPSYAGPLADVALNLEVWHILEPEFKEIIPAEIYRTQIDAMEFTVDIGELSNIMKKWRQGRQALMQN